MTRLSYREAIDFLFNLESSAIKLGLGNTVDLLAAIGDPQLKFESVHIAGTNGKGSVACFLNSILCHSRFRTGLFTSPHLVDYRERIRVNGAAIPRRAVSRAVSDIQGRVRTIGASYFEATTAVAFDWFARQAIDIAVVEVGMGGRLDSTNVIEPLATCITTIDFDHQKYLGRTLSRIAAEKAGIIKQGVPVVCGTMSGSALSAVKSVAQRKRARVFQVGKDASADRLRSGLDGSVFAYRGLGPRRILRTRLLGAHQVANAAVAVLAAEVLKSEGVRITADSIEAGIENAFWPGRFQVMRKRPLVICDGAHNASGARSLAVGLRELGMARAVTVFGVLRDKNYARMLRTLSGRSAEFVLTKPVSPRALPIAKLAEEARRARLGFTSAGSVEKAVRIALERARRWGRPVVICGSLYAVGEAMQFFGFKPHGARLC
jgi:dihydrofolate synthase/folylpolyglutamate synthase